jgi:hypothetical protein
MTAVKRMIALVSCCLFMIWWWSKFLLRLLLGRDQQSQMYISFFLGVLEAHAIGRYVAFEVHWKRPFEAESSSDALWLPETVKNPLFEQSRVCQLSFTTYEPHDEPKIVLPRWVHLIERICRP